MADLTGIESSLSVKITGNSLTGVETTPVNSNPLGSLYIDNRELKGNPIDTGLGNASTGTQRLVLAVDQTSIPAIINILTDPPQSNQIGTYTNNNKVFSVSGNFNAATAGVNNPIYLIKNPVTSTKTIYITKASAGTTITNVAISFKIFASPVVTINGTIRTPVNNKIGSLTASIAEVFSLSTVSSAGSELRNANNGQNSNSLNISDDSSIVITPGNSVLITANPSSNNRDVVANVIWIEI